MGKAKYLQIVDFIKERISNGEWTIGSLIPSQRELARIFRVNRSTVITALDELMAEGLIEAKAGSGTMVTNNTWTLMGNDFSPNWNENIAFGIHKASMATVQKINELESNSDFIQLSKGELSPDIFPLESMKKVVKKVSGQITPFGYEEPKGNLKLRQAISDYLQKRGIDASPASILVVSGALQGLQLISLGLLQRRTTVFLEKPSYLNSLSIFQSAGMELKGVQLDEEGLDFNRISLSNEKGRSVLYTNPTFHNPTGKLMTESRRMELIEFCRENQLPIIEDDVYRDLWIDSSPPSPLKSMDRYGNVLYIGSLSKTLSPGLRIGWLLGPESVISRLADLKMQSDYGSSTLSQYVAAEWLASGLYEEHLENVRKQLKIRRQTVLETLNKYLKNYADWETPKGGFFIWVKMKPEHKTARLFEKAYAQGILLNPSKIYENSADQAIRISYANAPLEKLKEGIIQLSIILKGESVKALGDSPPVY